MEKISDSLYITKGGDIEIGDSKQSEFYPQLKTKHWNNECNFSIRYITPIDGATITGKDGKLEWIRGSEKAVFYELENGFEFELHLAEKPTSNEFKFSINDKDFIYLPQDELTEWEKRLVKSKDRKGKEILVPFAIRPDNIIDSIAVYHKSKKNGQYKTGKAFHIERVFAIDSKGTKVWCKQLIENGIYKITLPQDFLNKAVYPIIIDPTLGYTSFGGTQGFISDDGLGCSFTPSEDGTVTSIVAGLIHIDGGGDSASFAKYSNLIGVPVALESYATSPTGTITTSNAWYTLSSFTNVGGSNLGLTNGTPTWLNMATSYATGVRCLYDTGATAQTSQGSSNISSYTWVNPWISAALYDVVLSIYANYTASGGALTQSLSDTITLSDSLSKRLGIALSDSLTLSDAIAKALSLHPTDIITLSDGISIIKAITQALSDTITISDDLNKSIGYNLFDSVTLSDSFSSSLSLIINDSVTLSDSHLKALAIQLTDIITLLDSISKALDFHIEDTIILSDSYSGIITLVQNLSDSITLSDLSSISTGISLSDSLTLTDDQVKAISLILNDSINQSENISKSFSINLSDSLSLAEQIIVASALAKIRYEINYTFEKQSHSIDFASVKNSHTIDFDFIKQNYSINYTFNKDTNTIDYTFEKTSIDIDMN